MLYVDLYNAYVQTVTSINRVFLDNMRQLWRHDAKLAQRIDELPMDATLPVQSSKKGAMTASVSTSDGRTLFLHSRYDPAREAQEFCKGLVAGDAACVILCGLGLGYHLKALFEHFGNETVVFVSEPDLITIKTALETTDLSKELATGQVVILTDLDKAGLHDRLSRYSTSLMLGTLFAVPPVARDHHADYHADCRKALMDFAHFAKMSLTTLVRNAGITCRNIANNLPAYVTTPPADVLRRRFAGFPAILVAAGPSLAKNIDQLRDLRDSAVIIAAQTTLRPLLERGIRPHFVTSLDFSDLSRQFFEGIDIPDDLVLVAEPKASWHVIDAFLGGGSSASSNEKSSVAAKRRRIILLDNQFAHRCVGEDLAKRTPMEPGATVMHLAFYLAQWLHCDPITFIGQDLGFSGHCYYAPGVVMHRTWAPELGRFCTLELKEWERIARSRAILRKVADIHDRPIYTDEQMFTYLEQFERDFAKCSAKVIDATEGGAKKVGAVVMTLEEMASRHCRRAIEPGCFGYLDANWFDASKLRPAREVLAARRRELDAFRALCDETHCLLHELQDLIDTPKDFNRRIARVDELRTLVQNHSLLFRMVRDVSQLAELQKLASDRRLAVDEVTGRARARRQLQRDRRFIESLLEGCDQLERIFDEALSRFDGTIEAARVKETP